MTTYRAIASTETDPEAPITSALMKAYQLNLLAGLEGDSTAPVDAYAWHPYNKVLVGDSNTGRIWSFPVDGAVATVTSPDFVDGYDYAFRFDQVMASSAAVTLRANLYRETSAAYAGATVVSASISTGNKLQAWFEVVGARITQKVHALIGYEASDANANSTAPTISLLGSATNAVFKGASHATAQKILKVQFSMSAGNITGSGSDGAIYLYRRRSV